VLKRLQYPEWFKLGEIVMKTEDEDYVKLRNDLSTIYQNLLGTPLHYDIIMNISSILINAKEKYAELNEKQIEFPLYLLYLLSPQIKGEYYFTNN
jgi:hypothetical protein